MSQPEQSALLTRAAKATLTPLGFGHKGRSRVWLGDRARSLEPDWNAPALQLERYKVVR
jgi:hypothetical protein